MMTHLRGVMGNPTEDFLPMNNRMETLEYPGHALSASLMVSL